MTARAPSPFYATCVGGLEAVVADEIRERTPSAAVTTLAFGRVHFVYDGPVAPLLTLRTIEHLHAHIAVLETVRPERAWLSELQAALAAIDLQPTLELMQQVREVPARPSFRVTPVRHGQHEFTSPEIGAAAGAGIVQHHGWPVDLESYDLDIRVEVRDTTAAVGLRLSAAALHRRSRVVHMRASLNPTVAAAMVRLSAPQSGETVLDPMTGAGTLITERYQHDAEVYLIAGDLYAEKLALAAENFAFFAVPVEMLRSDARALPLRTGAADKVLCNLPWGRIVANPRLNRRLYPQALAEIARVVRPGGVVVLLTSERRLLERTLSRMAELRLARQLHLHVGGLQPTLYVAHRL